MHELGRLRAAVREPRRDAARGLLLLGGSGGHVVGGGGTFGVVTAYTFRDLPAPPPSIQRATTTWQWDALDAASFATLLRNHGGWLAVNSAPDSPGRRPFGLLKLFHVSAGTVTLLTQASGEDPALLDEFLGALDDGVPAAALPTTTRRTMPWLQATRRSTARAPTSGASTSRRTCAGRSPTGTSRPSTPR
ncbi:hypothetical protein [Geodermatophilus maliterrae]|uniref:FAD binding domain-containing protein n=1 Tax=Geodermatophilus maliterrae TaxID=3162531 RepID=A0ABV3XCU1_9ACTN